MVVIVRDPPDGHLNVFFKNTKYSQSLLCSAFILRPRDMVAHAGKDIISAVGEKNN